MRVRVLDAWLPGRANGAPIARTDQGSDRHLRLLCRREFGRL